MILSPFFLTYDSYHYLNLSINPVYGDSHSLVYGFVLKNLMNLSQILGLKSFEIVYIVWNSSCYFCFFILLPFKLIFKDDILNRNEKNLLIRSLGVALYVLVLVSNLLLENALWSEMTCFLTIGLITMLSAQWINSSLKKGLIFAALIFPISYHTRYLTIIIPVAIGVIALVNILRGLRAKALRAFVLMGLMMVTLLACNLMLKKNLPCINNKKWLTSLAVSLSMQCTLRCETKMFETDCTTPAGKATVENSFCTEIVFGMVKMGNLIRDPNKDGLKGVFKQNGFLNNIKWLAMAPFSYLKDKHDLEVGLFRFGDDQSAASHYPEVIKKYGHFFSSDDPKEASKSFKLLITILQNLFHKYFFHYITVLILGLNFFMLLKSRFTEVQFLVLYSIGTFLLFAYANPHAPYRFLIQIISPSAVAFIIHCFRDSRGASTNFEL